MERRFSFLCDSANISQSGNLNVLGIFDSVAAPNFPCAHPQCFYIAKIEAQRAETGEHRFRVAFVDEDGAQVIPPFEGVLHFTVASRTTHVMLKMVNIMFRKPGVYHFDLSIDGQYIGTESITVSQLQQQNQQ